MDEMTTRLEERLRQHLRFLDDGQPLSMTTELRDLGLDSMGVLALIQDLEETFGILFSDELLTPETFRDATTIKTAIRSLLAT